MPQGMRGRILKAYATAASPFLSFDSSLCYGSGRVPLLVDSILRFAISGPMVIRVEVALHVCEGCVLLLIGFIKVIWIPSLRGSCLC